MYYNATGFPINYYKAKPMSSRTKYTDYDTFKGKIVVEFKSWFIIPQKSITIRNSSRPP